MGLEAELEDTEEEQGDEDIDKKKCSFNLPFKLKSLPPILKKEKKPRYVNLIYIPSEDCFIVIIPYISISSMTRGHYTLNPL